MPEPISSSSSPQSSGITPPSDPTLDETGLVCRSEAPNSSPPQSLSAASEPPPKPPAVAKLISATKPPTAALPPTSPNSYASEAQNNAQRTSERSGIGFYSNADVTGGARDSAYASIAALKGRDPTTGIEVEVFSASAQAGGESEVQAGLARVGLSGKHGSIGGEAFTVRANGGAHNDDGSTGFNAGFVATLIGFESTLTSGGDSLTLGASLGCGAALNFGGRDLDGNGTIEKCIKVVAGPVTIGICKED